ncbi:MAG: hypothetical protein QMD36_05390 [Candidatus Aenigmarchaeota archaeon]|nr:hypothetical protein [Candidatus Aenigmarchaeota archaeon]
MRYKWREELKTLRASLFYFERCSDELIKTVDNQWDAIEYMISCVINSRLFCAGGGRTGKSLKILPYRMKNFLGYDGRTRPCTYMIGEDENIPSHRHDDVGIVATGSATTWQAIQAMKTLTANKVKTFLLTYTPLEEIRERQKKEHIESVWDYFSQQEDYKKRVIFLPMREASEKDDKKRATLAPLGSKFEINTANFCTGMTDCIQDYHLRCEGSDTVPLKTMSYTLNYFKKYLSNLLIPGCYKYQDEIFDFVNDIMESNHIKIVASGEADMVGSCFVTRLVHCGFDGYLKSVHMIRSTDYGPPGSSNITSDDLVVGLSISAESAHTRAIMKEAVKKKAKKIVLITSNPHPDLEVDKVIIIPPTYAGYRGELAHLGLYVLLDGVISQVAKNKNIDEKDMIRLHSRYS